MIESLLSKRLIVLSGKGGVGRTTMAAILAHRAAAAGKQVLVAQMDAHERLSPLLTPRGQSVGKVGTQIVKLAPNIDAVNMTPRAALHEYGLLVLRYETIVNALLENRPIRSFLGAVPGLDAYSMLGKAWHHTTEVRGKDPSGPPRYDLVILDGPASGHATTLLQIPRAILTAMPRGPLSRDARSIMELLQDPDRAAFVIVTLAEEMPINEAVELCKVARDELSLPVGPIIVNKVIPDAWADPSMNALLQSLPESTGDAELDTTLSGTRAIIARRQEGLRLVQSLKDRTGLATITLPRLFTELGSEQIALLAAAI